MSHPVVSPLVEISLSHNSSVCSCCAMEAILDSQADMASFFTSVRKAHCINVQTPPSSPESNNSSKSSRPRLHLSKFLQRGHKRFPRRSSGTNVAPSSASCGERASKSPFRAVTEMKEPFPLMLPDSPALTDESSHDDERQRLRRISASHADLRAIARVQAPSVSNGNTPLLPSPMFKPDGDRPEADSYFAYPKRRDTPPPEIDEAEDAPYEVHRIISGYCKRERWSLLLDEVRQSKQASQLRHATCPWPQPAEISASSSSEPVTPPSHLKKRSRTYSAESDWLASNTSHEERYRRFKQRCCGMVQHPARKSAPARVDGEDEIMLATVLIGPGKPKLVQIQRPPSSTSRSSQAVTTTEADDDSPVTPLQAKKEISAFSPYDTPCQRTYGAMTPVMQLVSSTDSVQKLRPAPLCITSRTTRHRTDSAISVPGQYNSSHNRNTKVDSSPTPNNDSLSPSTIPPSTCFSSTIWSSPVPSKHTRTSTTLSSRKLSSALTLITAAIDAFPSYHLLHLDSPLTRQLRNTAIPAHAYVASLQRIFPMSSPLLLSALAAWSCVLRYLDRQMEEMEMEGTSATAEEEEDEDEDENEYEKEGRRYHDPGSSVLQMKHEDEDDFLQFQLRQHQHTPYQSKTSSSSSTYSRKTSNLRSTNPNPSSPTPTTNRFNINSSTNNTNANRIARSRNIHKNQTQTKTHALKTRISVVRISVEVVAQRLMEAIHGGWVEELWRGVGVVIDLVEGCEQAEQSGEEAEDGGGWVGRERNGEETAEEEEEWL